MEREEEKQTRQKIKISDVVLQNPYVIQEALTQMVCPVIKIAFVEQQESACGHQAAPEDQHQTQTALMELAFYRFFRVRKCRSEKSRKITHTHTHTHTHTRARAARAHTRTRAHTHKHTLRNIGSRACVQLDGDFQNDSRAN